MTVVIPKFDLNRSTYQAESCKFSNKTKNFIYNFLHRMWLPSAYPHFSIKPASFSPQKTPIQPHHIHGERSRPSIKRSLSLLKIWCGLRGSPRMKRGPCINTYRPSRRVNNAPPFTALIIL